MKLYIDYLLRKNIILNEKQKNKINIRKQKKTN